jgi:hypothetical protein
MLCFVEGQDGTNGTHLGSHSEGDGVKAFVLLERYGKELGESRTKIGRFTRSAVLVK